MDFMKEIEKIRAMDEEKFESKYLEKTAALEEKIRDFIISWNTMEIICKKQVIKYPPVITECPFIKELLDIYLPKFIAEVYKDDVWKITSMDWNNKVKYLFDKINNEEKNNDKLFIWVKRNSEMGNSNHTNIKELSFSFGVSKEVLALTIEKLKANNNI